MAARWPKVSYTADSVIPLLGEIILLRFTIHTVPFPYGPRSSFTAATINSRVCTNSSSLSTAKCRGTMHFVLVLNADHDLPNHKVRLTFLPIMSYSTFTGFTESADHWMSQQATIEQRLHHLPVPAMGWTPAPSPSMFAPVLSFGNWLNTRSSWLAMVVVRHDLLEDVKWGRHPDAPVILDGGATAIVKLFDYIHAIIPEERVQVTSTNIAVNTALLPNYYNVWTNMDGYGGPYMDDYGSLHDSEIDRALAGDDGIDPITFWDFIVASSPEMQKLAKEQQKSVLDQKVFAWNDGSCSEDACKETEIILDVEQVPFCEEACSVNLGSFN